jgi:hypothetical protein
MSANGWSLGPAVLDLAGNHPIYDRFSTGQTSQVGSAVALANDALGNAYCLNGGTIYERVGNAWTPAGSARALASDAFGNVYCLSGTTIYERAGSGWATVGTASSLVGDGGMAVYCLTAGTIYERTGGTWTAVGSASALVSDLGGAVYSLAGGRIFQRAGTTWALVGFGSALSADPSSTVYCVAGATIYQHAGSSWAALPTVRPSDGSLWFLALPQVDSADDHPIYEVYGSQLNLAGAGTALAGGAGGNVFSLAGGSVYQRTASTWSTVGSGSALVADVYGNVYCQAGTTIFQRAGTTWVAVGSGLDLVGDGGGSVYSLSGQTIYQRSGPVWAVAGVASALAGDTLGNVYCLADGAIYQRVGGNWLLVGTGSALVQDEGGNVYCLAGGTVYQRVGGTWSAVGGGSALVADGADNVYCLAGDQVFQRVGGTWSIVGQASVLAGDGSGDVFSLAGGTVFQREGNSWSTLPSIRANDGTVWFLGTASAGGGGNHATYQFVNGHMQLTGFASALVGDALGNVYSLAGTTIYQRVGGSWVAIGSASVLVSDNVSVYCLAGGAVYERTGNGWSRVGTGSALVADSTGTLYAFAGTSFFQRTGPGWTAVPTVRAADGTLWFLATPPGTSPGWHAVYQFTAAGLSKGSTAATQLAVDPAGEVVILQGPYEYAYILASGLEIGGGAFSSTSGEQFVLDAQGQLYGLLNGTLTVSRDSGSNPQTLATGVSQMAADAAGEIVALQGPRQYLYFSGGVETSGTGSNDTFSLDSRGELYTLSGSILTVAATSHSTPQTVASGVQALTYRVDGGVSWLRSDGTVWQTSGGVPIQIGQGGIETANGEVWFLGLGTVAGTTDHLVYELSFNAPQARQGAFNRILAWEGTSVWVADANNNVFVDVPGSYGWASVDRVITRNGDIWFLGQSNTTNSGAKNLYHYTGQTLSQASAVSSLFSQIASTDGTDVWLLTPAGQLERWDGTQIVQDTTLTTQSGTIWTLGPEDNSMFADGTWTVWRYDGVQVTYMYEDADYLIGAQGDDVTIQLGDGSLLEWNGSEWIAPNLNQGGSQSFVNWESVLSQSQLPSNTPSLSWSTTIDVSQSQVANDIVNFLKGMAQGNEGDAGVNELSIDLATGNVTGSFWIRNHQSWGNSLPSWLDTAYDYTVTGNLVYNFYTNDFSGTTIDLGHGINRDAQALYEASQGDFTSLIADCTGFTQVSNYDDIQQSFANQYGAGNVYMASHNFVDWAGPETLVTWTAEAVASAGSSLAAVPAEVADHLSVESTGIAAWLSSRLQNASTEVADQITNALASQRNIDTPLFSVQWQTVQYRYVSDVLSSVETPPISHLGFVIILKV